MIDLYGAPLCAAYLRDQGDPSFNLNVTSTRGPETWNWERDSRMTSFENVFEVQALRTALDQTTSVTLHFIQVEDGTFRWLTDCGVPIRSSMDAECIVRKTALGFFQSGFLFSAGEGGKDCVCRLEQVRTTLSFRVLN